MNFPFSRAFSSPHVHLHGKVLWKELHRICSPSVNGSSNSSGAGALIMRQFHQQLNLQTNYYSCGPALTSSLSSCHRSQGGHRHHHHNHFHLWNNITTTTTTTLSPRGSADGVGQRNFSTQDGSQVEDPTQGEITLKNTIKKCFPNAANINVQDISGGCGSMYQIYIEAPEFSGLSTVKQHRLVNEALKQEIKSMHGIRIQTAIPKKT